eukprot:UN14919
MLLILLVDIHHVDVDLAIGDECQVIP